jgi:drug/metabolite transporter (DMT)-like permease
LKSSLNTALWAVLACLLWSTAFAGIKVGLNYSTPLQFAGIRFFLSGLMILPFALKSGSYIQVVKSNYKLLILLTFSQTIINYALFYSGLNLVPGALGAIVIGAQPLIIALIAAIMIPSDSFGLKKFIAIGFGILGVVFVSVSRQSLQLAGTAELLGVLMLLGVNITSGFSNVLVARNALHINPKVLISISLLFGGLGLIILSIPLEGLNFEPKPIDYWISLLWLSFMSAAAFSIWFRLLQRPNVKVSHVNLWKFIIPVFGVILSWIILPDENPEMLTIIGIIIITISLLLFFTTNRTKKNIL